MITSQDRLVTLFIFTVWVILLAFGLLTLISPEWLVRLSDPGKKVEAATLVNLGDKFRQQGDFQSSIAAYKRALKIIPDNFTALGNLGVLYYGQGKMDDAEVTFKYIAEKVPDRAHTAYYNLGELYDKTGKPDLALEAYLKSSQLSPYPLQSYRQLGSNYFTRGEIQKALEYSRDAISLALDMNALVKSTLIRARDSSEESGEHLVNINTLLDEISLQDNISRLDYSIYKRLMARDHELAKTYNFYGSALTRLGRLEEALDAFEKAVSIWPDFRDANKNLKTIRQALN